MAKNDSTAARRDFERKFSSAIAGAISQLYEHAFADAHATGFYRKLPASEFNRVFRSAVRRGAARFV